MLKYNSYPPQTVDDVEFSRYAIEGGLDTLIGVGDSYEERTTELGNFVGSSLMANIEPKDLGSVLLIANGLADKTDTLLELDVKELFLRGVLGGAIFELSEIRGREGAMT